MGVKVMDELRAILDKYMNVVLYELPMEPYLRAVSAAYKAAANHRNPSYRATAERILVSRKMRNKLMNEFENIYRSGVDITDLIF